MAIEYIICYIGVFILAILGSYYNSIFLALLQEVHSLEHWNPYYETDDEDDGSDEDDDSAGSDDDESDDEGYSPGLSACEINKHFQKQKLF
ncbi:uncharacterized protein FPRO_06958 [Fusarium proliferatum ET1]|uniref:Uncharacterized protein n=1 Tax=Fusarium proliferatum (strain ET1) TaxID=1227346 RepID=A0A1L7VAT2_FUSPR|nr:uncharacterized protein FPRO_06958 [Fusarium proliferatum ET1]CZR37851.1 uncharacterized protein FPRO_06958 [Fusarium proliferatum ET1]